MKKLFSVLLTLALLAALCVPALAADPHAQIVYLPEGAVEALSEDGVFQCLWRTPGLRFLRWQGEFGII